LIKILQAVVDERRARKRNDWESDDEKKDMMELLMEVEYENGEKLEDEEIIDVILMYLNAGHESSAHATMWATRPLFTSASRMPPQSQGTWVQILASMHLGCS
jgi:ent-kaurenoic acid hydroxylase